MTEPSVAPSITARARAALRRAAGLTQIMTTCRETDVAAVDLDAALVRLRRFGGDALLRDMIDLFLEHAPARIATARQAVAAGDPRQALLALHSLVSSCAQLGAERMRALSGQAEQLATNASPDLSPLLDALAHELVLVAPLLVAARPPNELVP